MATQYQLVETYNASNVSNTPLMDQNTIIVEIPDDPWYRKGVRIGSYVLASTLSQLPGLSKIEKAIINPHKLRQLVSGMMDAQWCDVSGFYVVSDVGTVAILASQTASRWAKPIDRTIAPSIAMSDSGQENVSPPCDFTTVSRISTTGK